MDDERALLIIQQQQRINLEQQRLISMLMGTGVSGDMTGFPADEHSHNAFDKDGNGKVIGEFVCNKIATFPDECYAGWLVKHSCVSAKGLERYAGDNDSLYVWHISNLVIYDEPKELSRFLAPCDEDCASCKYWQYDMVNQYERDYDCTNGYYPLVPLKKGPQSWRYVEVIK